MNSREEIVRNSQRTVIAAVPFDDPKDGPCAAVYCSDGSVWRHHLMGIQSWERMRHPLPGSPAGSAAGAPPG
jgi:hypothetical protein